MKKLVLAIAATMMLTTASAQENNNEGQRGRRLDRTEMQKRQLDEMVKKYGLNEEQTAQLKDLNEKYGDRMMPMFGGGMRGGRGGMRAGGMGPGGMGQGRPNMGNGNGAGFGGGQRPEMTEEQRQRMEERRKEMEKTREEYTAELKKILTEDQFKAYQKDQEERMMQAPRGENRRPQRNNN